MVFVPCEEFRNPYICSLEIFTFSELPWNGVDELEAMERMRQREKLIIPTLCPKPLAELILLCWRLDNSLRPSARNIHDTIVQFTTSSESLQFTASTYVDPCDAECTIVDVFIDGVTWPRLDYESDLGTSSATSIKGAGDGIDLLSDIAVKAFAALEINPEEISTGWR